MAASGSEPAWLDAAPPVRHAPLKNHQGFVVGAGAGKVLG